MRTATRLLLGLSSVLAFTACSGDDDDDGALDGSITRDAGPTTTRDGGANDRDGGVGAARFTVTIENISGETALPGPFSPGAWILHDSAAPLFMSGQADYGDGLVAIAEDGDPTTLAAALPAMGAGAFTTPVGGAGPAPAFPGESYSFSFDGDPANPNLSFATMLVQTNDVFLAPDEDGIALFDANGDAIDPGDVTDQLTFWETGTESNQTPGQGPDQAPRQSAADVGRAPGVVGPFGDATRTLPQPIDLVDVTVAEAGGVFTVRVDNISGERGALPTPLSPLFYMTHDATVTLFTPGEPDRGEGIEAIAEDGDATPLVTRYTGATGVGAVAAQARSIANPGTNGPALPGDAYEFTVTPTAEARWLSIATMVVVSNDAFFAMSGNGVALLDDQGAARGVDDIMADIRRTLAVWDAGTEANEVPGVGVNQVQRQSAPDTGPADPDNTVRIYRDTTNDLAGALAGGFADVTVAQSGGDLEISIANTSGTTVFPGILTPVVWALHSDATQLYTPGTAASPGLERVAEDGNPMPLAMALSTNAEVSNSGVANTPVGAGTPGPAMPGDVYTFTVTPNAAHPMLSFVSMIVPSNDTFLATPPAGISLYDAGGTLRSATDIEADLQAMISAWDAGTEANQAGAGGRDQAPRQSGPDVGAEELPVGIVGPATADPVWTYPEPVDVVRVTITRE